MHGGVPCAKARLCGARLRDSANRILQLVDEVEKAGDYFTIKELLAIDAVEDGAAKVEEMIAEKVGAVIPPH